MNDYNKRKHLLLLSLLRTINEATLEIDSEETEEGLVTIPSFRYEPTFEFEEEDIQTIRKISEEEGEDFSMLTGDEET
jgi:hypothetical protein